jgi:HSP20 family protein
VSERRFGSFEWYFGLPEGVDTNKIDATFKQGVLKVTLRKTPESQKQEKKAFTKTS